MSAKTQLLDKGGLTTVLQRITQWLINTLVLSSVDESLATTGSSLVLILLCFL